MSIDLVVPTALTRAGIIVAIFRNMAVVFALRVGVMGAWHGPVSGYLQRARQRLVSLIERLEAGTWRAPRVRVRVAREPREGVARERRTPRVAFPARRAWLNNMLAPELRVFSGQLETLLNDPETMALLAPAAKQAERILRPLGRMLGLEFSIVGPVARRVRAPRAARPRRMTAAEHKEVLRYENGEGRPVGLYPGERRRLGR